jgi:hypothetical protein
MFESIINIIIYMPFDTSIKCIKTVQITFRPSCLNMFK